MIGALLFKLMAGSALETMNRRDLPAIMSRWHDDATFTYPMTGEIKGKKALEEFFRKFMEQFPEVKFKLVNVYVKNIFAFGLSNTVGVEWEYEITNREGKTFHNCGISTSRVRRGKVVASREYYYDVDKLREAWGVDKLILNTPGR